MNSYLFYDLETTGLNPCFDQIMQFAAVRTDSQFNELERHEFLVRLNPDTVPHPQALLTHGIGVRQTEAGLSEYEAARRIHDLLNEPGTISLGYNTLGFDDELLRFCFYRNLLPPYTHQYADGCGRMDIYPMTLMFYLFKPDALQWPAQDDKPSLKLEALNRCNDLATGQAHDAMVDVSATVALARILRREEKMWGYIQAYFNKKIDLQRQIQLSRCPLPELDRYGYGILVEGRLGHARRFQAPVLALGKQKNYGGRNIYLHLDTPELRRATASDPSTTRAIYKKSGVPPFVLPAEERFLSELDQTQVEDNLRWLAQHPKVFQSIAAYHRDYQYPPVSDLDVGASLYSEKFWSDEEHAACLQFHRAAPAEKAQLAATMHNPSLKQLAERILGRHFPEVMTTGQRKNFADYLKKTRAEHPGMDFKGRPRYRPQDALRDIDDIRQAETLTQTQEKLLRELENYLLT